MNDGMVNRGVWDKKPCPLNKIGQVKKWISRQLPRSGWRNAIQLNAITNLLSTIPNRRAKSRRTNVLACVISTFENSLSKETAAVGKEKQQQFL